MIWTEPQKFDVPTSKNDKQNPEKTVQNDKIQRWPLPHEAYFIVFYFPASKETAWKRGARTNCCAFGYMKIIKNSRAKKLTIRAVIIAKERLNERNY